MVGVTKTTADQFGQKHILTIALEEYFQAPAFRELIDRKRWGLLESRFEQNSSYLLNRLDEAQCTATFFVTPWTARRKADLLRAIVRGGHEVALAGPRGQGFRLLPEEVFRKQVKSGKEALERACGAEVYGFRVSDVLLRPRNLSALEVLAQEGFRYDSSLSPFLFAFASQAWRQFVHLEKFESNRIWEFPLSSHRLGRLMIPVAGGNYFRQYPEWFIRRALRRWHQRYQYPMVLYFRLWDFDPEQPRIETGSTLRAVRHYRNGERMGRMLDELLATYKFSSIANSLTLNQSISPSIAETTQAAVTSRGLPLREDKLLPITIIVPCYNEAPGIPYLRNALADLKSELQEEYDVNFVLVDDGSTDDTWQALHRNFSERVDTTLLRHERNRGVSAAIISGLEASNEVACSMDCDCSYHPHELRPMLRLLTEGVDMVTASPYHPGGAVLHVPAWRLGLSRGASLLYAMVTGCKLHTFTACFRVYRRSSVLPITVKRLGFLGVAELLSRGLLDGKTVVEHPATLECRIFGRSKMKIARTVVGHLGLLSELLWFRLNRDTSVRAVESDSSRPPNASTVASEAKL